MFEGAEITGDWEISESIGDVDLIVATPEKWDSITRKWSDHKEMLSSITLIIVPKHLFYLVKHFLRLTKSIF